MNLLTRGRGFADGHDVRLNVNKLEIQLERTGSVESDAGPAILFIHGAGGDPSIWAAQAYDLGKRRLVYRMALPGHGDSAGTGAGEIHAYAQWVRMTLDALGSQIPLLVVGHSMGGAIALELALDPPSLMKGAVVVSSGAKLAVSPDIFEMLQNDPPSFFQFMERNAFALTTPREIRDPIILAMRRCPPSLIHDDFQACHRFDIRSRLEEIQLPTLIICGDEDRLTPVGYSEYLLEHITGSRLRVISQAGHMVMAEQPAPLNQAIEKFIKDLL